MLDAAVDDVRGLHPAVDRVDRVADLGDHAAGDGAVGDQRVDLARRQPGQELPRLVEHARGVGHEDDLLGLQHAGDLAGGDVGVDVVGVARGVGAERRDHRDEVAGVEHLDDLGVDAGDLADLADVEHLIGLFLARHQHLLGVDEVAILAGQPHRAAAVLVDQGHDVLVDQAAQDHLDDVEGLLVGHPHALDELALLADALQEAGDLRAAAVHHHRVHPHQLQEHHVLGEGLHQVALGHGVAAVLDDDGLVVEALDVGQRLGQDVGLLGGGVEGGHGGSGLNLGRILRQ